ncbi:LytTR family transcriptional regulator DNA-binding domain-containing protein [Phaeobacter inhibens]|uniref:LytTR family transcriptional regulator DNA-binding domain-containing protein n=1 Tax=Phaeobacter inhibens TaxID=221822 RepID=UPI000C9CF78F|nr:LytTR family transcriptional regulator DNA-binding domain-containing protein [Phaeobacter inhibens]
MEGVQCHRSPGGRLKHCRRISSCGSAYVCEMSNGDAVPVSRRKYALVREWLNRASRPT